MKHKIFVVTTSRADFGIYQSFLKSLSDCADVDLFLVVGGAHLDERFGHTLDEIEAEGFVTAAKVWCTPDGDRDADIANVMGVATSGFAKILDQMRPDLLMVLGDRYEMFCAALAALPLRIPVAHIHGGEETEGAIDNSLRHALTKLSHLHLCSTELSARRIRSMGEDPDRIIVCGAPALDRIMSERLLSRSELTKSLGVPDRDFLLLTYHPETLHPEKTLADFDLLWEQVAAYCCDQELMCLTTLSNADTMGQVLNERIGSLASNSEFVFLVNSMGAVRFYSAMREARMMIGNSSSGIIEAASLGCPVINVGDRQRGRERSLNTIDTPLDAPAIRAAIKKAGSAQFRNATKETINVYGDGFSGPRIIDAVLNFMSLNASITKKFYFCTES